MGRQARLKLERKGQANLTETFGLSYTELLIAAERYKQQEAQVKEAKTHQKSITVTMLPGTTLDVSPTKQAELVRRAREEGVSTGMYEDWELMQFGDYIISLRDDQHLEYYQKLITYVDVGGKLLRHLDMIAFTVRNAVGNLWVDTKTNSGTKRVFPFSEVDAGRAGDYWIQLGILAEGLEIDPTTIPPVDGFVNGIRKLINEKDRGQTLSSAVDEYDPSAFEDIQAYIDMLPKTGAPPIGVIDRLCIRAKPYINNGIPYGKALDRMITDLDKVGLNRIEQEEAKKLTNWSAAAFEKAYRARMGKQVSSVP